MSPLLKNVLGVVVILAVLCMIPIALVHGGVLAPEMAQTIVVTAAFGAGVLAGVVCLMLVAGFFFKG